MRTTKNYPININTIVAWRVALYPKEYNLNSIIMMLSIDPDWDLGTI